MTGGPVQYEPIALSPESTVVAKFIAEPSSESGYQSEADLERSLIEILKQQAYEHLRIASEADLIANLRAQLEALNGITFSDSEWDRFFSERIAGERDGIEEKTYRLQEDHVQLLRRDDGTFKNVTLARQVEHPQQPPPGHQPVRDDRHLRQPLRRDHPRERPADGARRDQAPRRRHPGCVQPDQSVPARQLLVRLGPLRVRPAVRHLERDADEVLQQHDATRARRRGRPAAGAPE